MTAQAVRYALRKVVLFLITLWAAITLNFILPRLMPGSPVDAALGEAARTGQPVTDAQRRAIEIQLGLAARASVFKYFDYLATTRSSVRGSYTFPTRRWRTRSGRRCPGRWCWSA